MREKSGFTVHLETSLDSCKRRLAHNGYAVAAAVGQPDGTFWEFSGMLQTFADFCIR